MTPAEILLPKLSEWRPAGSGRHTRSEPLSNGWAVHLTAEQSDALGCRLWDFAAVRTGEAPDGLTLRSWAEGIAARAVGLLEPLKVHEIDETRQEALLRSTAPSRAGDAAVAYYEMRLFGLGRAELRRFRAGTAPGQPREQIPYTLTHEVLAKLASDIML